MHTISIHETEYPIPSQWDELSPWQLRRIAWLSTLQREGLARTKLFFFILTFALPLRKRLSLQWFYLVQATTEERGDFLLLVDSFQENRKFTVQLLPKLWVRTVLLFGPDSGLQNCTFFEFIQAEQYFLNHVSGHQASATTPRSTDIWLHKLIATLYRQRDRSKVKDQDPDIRLPLNDIGIRYRTTLVHHLDQDTKTAILIWFDGCRQKLIKSFPLIFQKGSPEAAKPTGSRSTANPWLGMISELSANMTEYERIGNTNLYTAMTDISFRIQKANQAKKEAAARARSSKSKR